MGLHGNKSYPWYKERLKTKYAKDVNPILNHKNWTFVKNGLDDFRDGMPPDPGEDWVVKPSRGPEPNLMEKSKNSKLGTSRSQNTKRLTPIEAYYSKQIPAADRRRRRVAELEKNLLGHPLALFPTLENGLSPELYEEIVDILDPDLLDMAESETSQSGSQSTESDGDISVAVESMSIDDKPEASIPYEKLFRKKRNPTDNIKTLELERHEKKIKDIAQGFVEWSKMLGEDGPSLGEDTIQALFASGYSQSKQTTSSVHVVELGSIPPELRVQAGLQPVPPDPCSKLNNMHKSDKKPQQHRYGAWYLKPETWKRLEKDEPIIDPEEIARNENNEAKKAAHDLHVELAPLHGTVAFRKYLDTMGRKKPEFMKEIAKIQDEELNKDH